MSTYIQNFLKFRPLLSELVSREIMMWGIQNEVYQSDQFAQFGNEFKVDNLSGSVGKAKRLEGICINILSIPNVKVRYCTHVQDIGWQREKENGQLAGTKGKAKRLEESKIYLSGKDADKYDIYYQVHAQDYGCLDWAKNGEEAGTEGLSKHLEAIRIVVLNRGEVAPGNTDRRFVKK